MSATVQNLKYGEATVDRLSREHQEYHETRGELAADASTCTLCRDIIVLRNVLPAARDEIQHLGELARLGGWK